MTVLETRRSVDRRRWTAASVAARYAVAITPVLADLIDRRRSATIRSRGNLFPMRASLM